MHEIGIVDAILEAAQTEAGRRKGAILISIGVRVGALSGVDKEALRFAFTALTLGTDLQEVRFEILSCNRRNRCFDCSQEFETPMYVAPCPCCRSEKIAFAGGDELDLAYVEVEDP